MINLLVTYLFTVEKAYYRLPKVMQFFIYKLSLMEFYELYSSFLTFTTPIVSYRRTAHVIDCMWVCLPRHFLDQRNCCLGFVFTRHFPRRTDGQFSYNILTLRRVSSLRTGCRTIMRLYVGFLWSLGEDDMWVSDSGGRAGCSDKR